jgi:hypothetical protein
LVRGWKFHCIYMIISLSILGWPVRVTPADVSG